VEVVGAGVALIAVVAVLVDCDWVWGSGALQVLDVSLCHQNGPIGPSLDGCLKPEHEDCPIVLEGSSFGTNHGRMS